MDNHDFICHRFIIDCGSLHITRSIALSQPSCQIDSSPHREDKISSICRMMSIMGGLGRWIKFLLSRSFPARADMRGDTSRYRNCNRCGDPFTFRRRGFTVDDALVCSKKLMSCYRKYTHPQIGQNKKIDGSVANKIFMTSMKHRILTTIDYRALQNQIITCLHKPYASNQRTVDPVCCAWYLQYLRFIPVSFIE